MRIVEKMAADYWRISRNWAIENYLLESAAQPEGPELPRIAAASPNCPPGPHLQHLQPYETRLHVIYQRALYNLLMLRTSKKCTEPKVA
jgi:hypothetical protein